MKIRRSEWEQVGETPAKTTEFRRKDGSLLVKITVGPIKHLRRTYPNGARSK